MMGERDGLRGQERERKCVGAMKSYSGWEGQQHSPCGEKAPFIEHAMVCLKEKGGRGWGCLQSPGLTHRRHGVPLRHINAVY